MSLLAYRRDRLDRIVSGKFAPSSSSTVVVYRAGAQVKGNQTGTVLNVLPGHYFPTGTGSRLIIMRYSGGVWAMVAGSRRIVGGSAPTTVTVGASLTVLDGDFLVNLGGDTGNPIPNFNASTTTIYATGDITGVPISQSRITPNVQGEYQYFPAERNIWELVISGTTPQELRAAVPLNDFGGWTISVTDFGAIGDGVTDDTAAFLAAAAYLPATVGLPNGGSVFVPRGTYIISSTITWTSGVVVNGESAWSTTIKCKAGFTGGAAFLFQKPAAQYANVGIGVRNLRLDCNNQTCHGIHMYKPYDGVTIDTVYVDNVFTTKNAYRLEPDPNNPAPADVSQTITLLNTYAIHGGSNATGALYYFDHCQEMSLVNCKGISAYVVNGVGANDVFYFRCCRGVAAVGLSGGGTFGNMIHVLSDSTGYSQGLFFFGTTIETSSTDGTAAGDAVTVEGSAFAGPGPGNFYVSEIEFHGMRKQSGAVTPPITTGGFNFKNVSRGYADARGWTAKIDAACSDIHLKLDDDAHLTSDAGVRTHVDCDFLSGLNRFHRAIGESLTLYEHGAGGVELNLAVRGRSDLWQLLWAASAVPADFGLQLRYRDGAGVYANMLVADALGTILRLYGPAGTENVRLEAQGATPLLGLRTPTGGIPRNIGTWPAFRGVVADGTDSACTNGTVYVGSVFVPSNMQINGIQYLIGSVGGTDKVVVSIHDALGAIKANSATAGTTVGTAGTIQRVPLTAPFIAVGPGWFFVGVTFNGTTAKFRTVPTLGDVGSGIVGNGLAQTFGTPAVITPPTTFTANTVPIASLY